MNPFPFILSSPSGGGKTTIARLLLERRPANAPALGVFLLAPLTAEYLAGYDTSTGDFGALLFGLLQARYTADLRLAGWVAAEADTQAFLLAFQGTFWAAAAVATVACIMMGSSHFVVRSSSAWPARG